MSGSHRAVARWSCNAGIAAPLVGEGVSQWLERSPIFHLARIRTPTRYEHLGVSYVLCQWDMFAVQRHLGRPVEMIAIPDASHNVRQPYARYTSQEGNVDWFAFWLKGEEDPDPAKADQYRRCARCTTPGCGVCRPVSPGK